MSNALFPPSGDDRDEASGTMTFSLEVRGGRTGFRRRPIMGDRFLIGSNAVCDLRLDGRLAAPLHCLLHRDGDRLEAEGLSGAAILVNGIPVETAELAPGDTLGIGGVRLIVHAVAVRFDVIRPGDFEFAESAPTAPECTASQLVDRIEEEQERIEDFQDRRRAGADALLDAVRRSKRPASGAIAGQMPAAMLQRLIKRVDEIAGIVTHQPLRVEAIGAKRALLASAERLAKLAATFKERPERPADRAA
jgi:hypothetical protein